MKRMIVVAPKGVLLSVDYVHALAASVTELRLSRRRTPDWLAETLFGFAEAGGQVVTGEGALLDLHDCIVDEAHGADASFEWVSAQKRRVANPPRRAPRSSMLLRLQLYDAAFRIVGKPVRSELRHAA
jgi:hypothetical protein